MSTMRARSKHLHGSTTATATESLPAGPGREKALWQSRLQLRDALAAADLAGRHHESRRLERDLADVNDLLFPSTQKPATRGGGTVPFRYEIPIIDRDSRARIGFSIADETGVNTPAIFRRPLPKNPSGRKWLRPLNPTREVKDRARLAWHAAGHQGSPVCPGCRARSELVYLEFRNGDADDRFRSYSVAALCEESGAELLDRSREVLFGVTTLGRQVVLPCARVPVPREGAIATRVEHERPSPSARGKHRNPRSLANLRPNARNRAGDRKDGHSLRVKPALEAAL